MKIRNRLLTIAILRHLQLRYLKSNLIFTLSLPQYHIHETKKQARRKIERYSARESGGWNCRRLKKKQSGIVSLGCRELLPLWLFYGATHGRSVCRTGENPYLLPANIAERCRSLGIFIFAFPYFQFFYFHFPFPRRNKKFT